MIQNVDNKNLSLENYRPIISHEINKIKSVAAKLEAKKILHLNSTSQGGGVAEILQSLVPLQKDLGIQTDWKTFDAPAEFFEITKKMHNSLQGGSEKITTEEFDFYLDINKKLALELDNEVEKNNYDLIIFHDPQPMACASFLTKPVKKMSRIHIDLSNPNPKTLDFFEPFLEQFDGLIFSLKKFIPQGLNKHKVSIIHPAIDPLDPKNINLDEAKKEEILEVLNIDSDRPFISQVSRFDYWKNPEGVLDIYLELKANHPTLQLVMLGVAFAKDDPEAIEIYNIIKEKAGDDPDIHLFFNPEDLQGYSNKEVVNTIQSESLVVLQNSIREGFGLTATEAMWKGNVLIAGNVGGLKIQVKNRRNGFLINNTKEGVSVINKIIKNPKLKTKLGIKAKLSVKKRFLITRLLKNHLTTYTKVLKK